MTMRKYWAWNYEIKEIGSWPTRPPYTGHNEPAAVYMAAEVEAVLKELRDCLEEVAGCECYQPYGIQCWKATSGEAPCTACEAQRLLKELQP